MLSTNLRTFILVLEQAQMEYFEFLNFSSIPFSYGRPKVFFQHFEPFD